MPGEPPSRDPIRKHQRDSAAARRVGLDAKCACGEARPLALIPGSKPMICAACDRRRREQKTEDDHHVAGKANSPVTSPIFVNDHRAILSPAQYEWPKETLENPHGDQHRQMAAWIRGFIDIQQCRSNEMRHLINELLSIIDKQSYLLEELLRPLPEMLESRAEKPRGKPRA